MLMMILVENNTDKQRTRRRISGEKLEDEKNIIIDRSFHHLVKTTQKHEKSCPTTIIFFLSKSCFISFHFTLYIMFMLFYATP